MFDSESNAHQGALSSYSIEMRCGGGETNVAQNKGFALGLSFDFSAVGGATSASPPVSQYKRVLIAKFASLLYSQGEPTNTGESYDLWIESSWVA